MNAMKAQFEEKNTRITTLEAEKESMSSNFEQKIS
jgi:hypothetical protein